MNNDYYESAKSYLKLGFNPIPLRPSSKKPAIEWDKWQDKNITEQDLEIWNNSNLWSGVAIICGSISGIAVFDADSLEAYAKIKSLSPPTRMVASGSGKSWHFYVRIDGYMETKRVNTPIGHVDFQADNTYVVAPPSLHERTNKPYSWISNFNSISHISEFSKVADWLKPFINTSNGSMVRKIIIGEKIKEGLRNDSLFRYGCYLLGTIKKDELPLEPQIMLHELQRVNDTQLEIPLSRGEIENLFKSILKYKRGGVRVKRR